MTSTVDFPAQNDSDDTEPIDTGSRPVEWEAEYDRILRLDPHEVVIDTNVRTDNVTTDPGTVRDMRRRGVEQAVRGYRAADGTVMITMGQRRVLNAREAGVEIPVWMQAPPATDERKATIDRIVAQVNENTLRDPLTVGDEARAARQLAAFDLTPVGIARKLSRPVPHVRNLLAVGKNDLAAAAGERYALDLDKLAVIAEFEEAGELDTATLLIQTALERPNNFAVLAEHKRRERDENARFAELAERLRTELADAGITVLDDSVPVNDGDARALARLRPCPDDAAGTDLTLEEHRGCPGHAAWIVEDYDEQDTRIPVARYGCADFRAHGHAMSYAPAGQADHHADTAANDLGEPDQAAQEQTRLWARIERRWVRENNKLFDAATPKRREWLAAFARRRKAPQGAQRFLAWQKARGSHESRRAMERHHPLAHTLLDLPAPILGMPSPLPGMVAEVDAAKATVYDVFLTLCAMEDDLSRNAWRHARGVEQDYLRTLIEWGYDASDIEHKVLDPERVEDVIAAELSEGALGGDSGESAVDEAA